jgi:tetratricopeptide (TPR) repeat protein
MLFPAYLDGKVRYHCNTLCAVSIGTSFNWLKAIIMVKGDLKRLSGNWSGDLQVTTQSLWSSRISLRLMISICVSMVLSISGHMLPGDPVQASPQKTDTANSALDEVKQAEKLYNSKNYRSALALATQAIQKYPKYSSLYWIRGATFLELEQPKAALQDFDAYTKTSGKAEPFVHEARARCFVELGDGNAAIKELDQAITKEPSASAAEWQVKFTPRESEMTWPFPTLRRALQLTPKTTGAPAIWPAAMPH